MASDGSYANEIKLFGKWAFDEVEVNDISIEDYVAVKTSNAVYLPHTAGRYQKKRFRKANCPIVERLACALMFNGRNASLSNHKFSHSRDF